MCLRGSDLTAALERPPVLVGVVSLGDLPLGVAVALCLVATVTLRPLESVGVAFPWRRRSAFLLVMAVWVLDPNTAVVSPTSIPLREVLVLPDAETLL